MLRHLPVLAAAALCASGVSALAAPAPLFNFSALSGTSFGYGTSAATATAGNATFSTTASGTYSFGPNAGLYSELDSTVLTETDATYGQLLTVTFATPVTTPVAFAFASETFSTSDVLDVSVNGGAAEAFTATDVGSDLYPEGTATLSGTAISSLTFSDPAGNSIVLADVPAVAAVPEPASFALLAAGLVGLGFVRRRNA